MVRCFPDTDPKNARIVNLVPKIIDLLRTPLFAILRQSFASHVHFSVVLAIRATLPSKIVNKKCPQDIPIGCPAQASLRSVSYRYRSVGCRYPSVTVIERAVIILRARVFVRRPRFHGADTM